MGRRSPARLALPTWNPEGSNRQFETVLTAEPHPWEMEMQRGGGQESEGVCNMSPPSPPTFTEPTLWLGDVGPLPSPHAGAADTEASGGVRR